jgi:hypothetical protein
MLLHKYLFWDLRAVRLAQDGAILQVLLPEKIDCYHLLVAHKELKYCYFPKDLISA